MKDKLLLLAMLALLPAASRAQSPSVPLVTDALVSEWRFDDGSGQTLRNSIGSNHGTVGGGGTEGIAGPAWVREGLLFSGNGANSDCVRITSFFDPGAGEDFSVMVVAHYDAPKPTRSVLLSQQDGAGVGRIWLGVEPGVSEHPVSSGWHSFAMTYGWASGMRTLHLDGNQTAQTAVTPEAATGAMLFGCDKSLTIGWGDIIGYGLFYGKQLSASEVSQNHAALRSSLAGRGITLP